MRHFVECVRDGATPRETYEDGYIVNCILDAGYHSMREGRWVNIDLERDLCYPHNRCKQAEPLDANSPPPSARPPPYRLLRGKRKNRTSSSSARTSTASNTPATPATLW